MVKRAARQPRVYVCVFQVGKSTRGREKPVPAAFAASPCYLYRDGHERFAEELNAIPEPEVSAADTEATFAAIDMLVTRCHLRPELYSDAEIEAGGKHSENRGFHAGAGLEKVTEALVRGGFVVRRAIDPFALPRVRLTPADKLEQDVADLERHLNLTSLALVLGRLDGGAALTLHAGQASALLTFALGGPQADAFAERVRTQAPGWHPELRETLLLLIGSALQGTTGKKTSAALRALFTALPPAEDAAVRRRLAAWGLSPDESAETAKPVKAKATRRG